LGPLELDPSAAELGTLESFEGNMISTLHVLVALLGLQQSSCPLLANLDFL
jgi:hypothetical protein